jgi:hypothetical protein
MGIGLIAFSALKKIVGYTLAFKFRKKPFVFFFLSLIGKTCSRAALPGLSAPFSRVAVAGFRTYVFAPDRRKQAFIRYASARSAAGKEELGNYTKKSGMAKDPIAPSLGNAVRYPGRLNATAFWGKNARAQRRHRGKKKAD